MDAWTIEYYETADGYSPVLEYLAALVVEDAKQVADEIDFLEALGIAVGMPHVRSIQGSRLWELRIRGRNHHRIFYVTVRGRRLSLLHAFAKKTQKTPNREIRAAERYLADYEERFGR
jgi:phage-related protein